MVQKPQQVPFFWPRLLRVQHKKGRCCPLQLLPQFWKSEAKISLQMTAPVQASKPRNVFLKTCKEQINSLTDWRNCT